MDLPPRSGGPSQDAPERRSDTPRKEPMKRESRPSCCSSPFTPPLEPAGLYSLAYAASDWRTRVDDGGGGDPRSDRPRGVGTEPDGRPAPTADVPHRSQLRS